MLPTINEFINKFEKEFGKYLGSTSKLNPLPSRPDKEPPIHISHFRVCKGENEFSDWDLDCYVNATLKTLSSISNFILDFDGFLHTKYIIGKNTFQFMAFMPKETHAPFLDLHFVVPKENIKNRYDKNVDSTKAQQEKTEWLLITLIRKIKNNTDKKELDEFKKKWLKNRLSVKEYKELNSKPIKFFTDYFVEGKYRDTVKLLS